MARTDRATALIIEGASKQKSLTANKLSHPVARTSNLTCAYTEAKTKTPAALHPDKHTTWCVLRCRVAKPDRAPPPPLCITAAHPLQAPGAWPNHFLAAVATASFLSFASSFCFLLGVMPDFFVPSRVSVAAAAAAPVVAAGGDSVKNLRHTEP